ncbi:MAG: FAD-dependent oxidoreductase [Caulobacter sp.]|nr:FAD-dependent oxidoreductase [Caulobacter sp.]
MRVLLIGAGHAHLGVVRQAARLRAAGIELHLISPPVFRYSGLATGVLSGALEPAAGEIDVAGLAEAFGVAFHPSEVTAIDRDSRQVTLPDGATLTYDALSLNIGSRTADPSDLAAQADVWPVKPLSRLLDLRARLEADITRTGVCPNLVIAGTGQAGLEAAAALAGLCERRRVTPRITLVGPASGARESSTADRALRQTLERRGVVFMDGAVAGRGPDVCRLASGQDLACRMLVLATGLMAPDLVGRLGLATDRDGRLLTRDTLQTAGDDRVFATGDCAVIASAPRPCVGVFGVRATPVLVHNLAAMARGRRMTCFRPQTSWLSIMDLGDGTGLAQRGRWWWLGRASLHLKRRIDLDFIRRMGARPPVGDKSTR